MVHRPTPAAVEGLESRRQFSGVVALSEGTDRLFQFNTETPDVLFKATRIKGLAAGDTVVGIDFRPASNELYGVVDGTVDRVIKINPVNGKISTTFTLTTPLTSGEKFGVDFNPVVDALRITSSSGQNLRVLFASGTTVADSAIAFNANDLNGGATPNVVASAYSNSYAGTTSTILYDIDSAIDSLTVQNPPNAGTLVTRGPLGLDTGPLVGFDVEPSRTRAALTNAAYVTLTRAGDPGARLYTISLATGATVDLGPVGGTTDPRNVRAIAVVPVGGPTAAERRAAKRAAAAAPVAPAAALAAESRQSVRDRDDLIG